MSKKLFLLTSFVLVLAFVGSASAQIDPNNWLTCWWSNGSTDSNLWSDADNWYAAEMWWDDGNGVQKILEREPNQVPGVNDIALIGKAADWIPYPNDMASFGPIGSCLIDSSVTANPYFLFIGGDATEPNQPNHLEMTGGTLTIRVGSDDWTGLHVGGYMEHGVGSMTVRGNSIVDVNYQDPADPYGGLLDIGGGVDINDYNTVGTFTMDDNAIVKCYHFDAPDAYGSSRMEAHFNLLGGNFYITADNVGWGTFWLGETGSAQTSTFDVHDGKVTIESSGIEEDGPEQFVNLINGWIDEGKITAFGGAAPRAELYVSYDPVATETTLQAISTTLGQAWNPDPRPGSRIDYRPVLGWSAGDYSSGHDVYFGTDETAVENATTSSPEYKPPRLALGTTSYNPGLLELDTRYYWRIDEINGVTSIADWPGLVWDFKTANYLMVDDFESYVSQTDLWNVWDDYWVNSTGAEVFVETDANFVRSGTTSMKYLYDSAYVSKGACLGSIAETDTTSLGISSDWSASGIEALVLYFNGEAGNSATAGDQMWLQLEDTSSNSGTVMYDGDTNDLAVYTYTWTEWNIDLSDANFSGVSMANIDKIHIGFGGPTAGGNCKTGGSGNLYFDDIGLYPSRCVPAYGPSMDLNGDCIVNWDELELVINDWLLHGFDVNSTPPATAPLAHYTLDTEGGTGIKVTNSGSLGSAGNGKIIDFYSAGPGGPLTWETPGANHPDGSDPNYCIQVSGYIDQWVEVNDFNSIVGGGFTTNTLTISAWVKRSGDQYEWTGLVVATDNLPADEPDVHAALSLGANDDWTPEGDNPALNTLAYHWANVPDACDATPDGWDQIWWWRSGLLVPDGQWTFCAVAIQPEEASMYMYVPGGSLQKAVNTETHLPETFLGDWNIGRDARTLWGERTLNGQIDDVRIYDYALSDSEVLYLAGVASTHVPVPSNVDFDSSDDIDFVDYGYIADEWLLEVLWP